MTAPVFLLITTAGSKAPGSQGADDDAASGYAGSAAETNEEDEEVRLLRPAAARKEELDPDFERELAALTLSDPVGAAPAISLPQVSSAVLQH